MKEKEMTYFLIGLLAAFIIERIVNYKNKEL